MTDEKKPRKKPGRSVRPVPLSKERVAWPHFERITSQRLRLKPEVSRTYFALALLFADEFDAQRAVMTARGLEASNSSMGYLQFLKHASSAMRMLAERLLKSFRLSDVADAERYSLEQWESTVRRLQRGNKLYADAEPVAPSVVAQL